MHTTFKVLLTAVFFLSLDGKAEVTVGDVTDNGLKSGIYQFTGDTSVRPLAVIDENGSETAYQDPDPMTFLANEKIAVELLASGDVQVTLVPYDAEVGEVPEVIVVSRADFDRLPVQYRENGGVEKLGELTERMELAYRGNYRSAGHGRHRGNGRHKVARLHYDNSDGCVAFVKMQIGWRGPIGNGVGVTSTLRRHGWRGVSCANPPVRAVGSWRGGHKGSGHTAIWTGRCWAYDLECADPGSRYRLFDCVVRDGGGNRVSENESGSFLN